MIHKKITWAIHKNCATIRKKIFKDFLRARFYLCVCAQDPIFAQQNLGFCAQDLVLALCVRVHKILDFVV
jgi:hypothetical protein